jgi:glutamate/tyrosine decarboxylase-like PLP-dependent enzyme
MRSTNTQLLSHLQEGLEAIARWQGQWPAFDQAPELRLDDKTVSRVIAELTERLTDNYPFFHPQYAGQMLKPPHPVAAIAYAIAMQINPNNHALDGGPATARLEREAVADLARMFGFDPHLGHLTSSGTIANLEALWVAKCLHPGKAIAFSSQAHYTHGRMAEVLGIRGVTLPVDAAGRMDLAALEEILATGSIGTVVATPGTTGLGAIDPLDRIIPLAMHHGARVHVDAAYGGYFRLLADLDPSPVAAEPFRAIAQADSVVVDPHKHGLQPYGCGCVIFRDPAVGALYRHDSPYTYFTSDDLHLGEISLECSRAGAAAAALWATLRCFPLSATEGMGPILQATRRAALNFAARLTERPSWHLVTPPELDIVTYWSDAAGLSASAISRETDRIFQTLMTDPAEPLYLAKFTVPRSLLAPSAPEIAWDQETVTVLRSCLMKPEQAAWGDRLVDRLDRATSPTTGRP